MRRFLGAVAFAGCVVTASATDLIVDQRPYYARSVSGLVTDQVGYAMAGVTVQMVRCDAAKGRAAVLRQTVSDGRGAFGFGRFSAGKTCLRFSKDGFDVVQIMVMRNADATELALKMPVGMRRW